MAPTNIIMLFIVAKPSNQSKGLEGKNIIGCTNKKLSMVSKEVPNVVT